MSTTQSPGYVRCDELQQALENGRLAQVFEGTGLRLIAGFPESFSLYDIASCHISNCGKGARLPDELREALEAHWNRQILHRGPPTSYTIDISRQQVVARGASIGNWVGLRHRHPRVVHVGAQTGHITNVEWRAPQLKLLGIDLDRKQAIYEYLGEGPRG